MEYLQLELVSDGTREGTYLIDRVSGNKASNVINYRLEMDANNHLRVAVTFIAMPVEIKNSPKIITSLNDLFDGENNAVDTSSPSGSAEYLSGI